MAMKTKNGSGHHGFQKLAFPSDASDQERGPKGKMKESSSSTGSLKSQVSSVKYTGKKGK